MEKWEGMSVGEITRIALKEIRDAILETIYLFGKPDSPKNEFEGMMIEKPKRARTKKGKYKADDKSTPNINEAWVGGKSPKKK